jgi:hypothetical protein
MLNKYYLFHSLRILYKIKSIENVTVTILYDDLIFFIFIRVLKHLGCPHGCADGQRGPPADFLRSQGQNILSKLHRASPRQFSRFFREMVCNQTISDVLDFFHAYVGFCVDPSSLLSPLSKNNLPVQFYNSSILYDYSLYGLTCRQHFIS